MDGSWLGRAVAFLETVARRQAGRVVPVSGGFAVLNPDYAASYLNNKLIVTDPVAAPDAVVAADEVLGGAGLAHRLVEAHLVIDAQPFLDAGYQQSTNVVMCHTGDGAVGGAGAVGSPPAADPGIRVEPVDLTTMIEDGRREWRAQYPDMADEAVEQLARRRSAIQRGADEVTFLGVRQGDEVIARADLYVDRAARVAQIEDVVTDPEHRNRGLARAVLAEGLRRARMARCDLVFLVADADDWPAKLYARLGYEAAGHTYEFIRPAPEHR